VRTKVFSRLNREQSVDVIGLVQERYLPIQTLRDGMLIAMVTKNSMIQILPVLEEPLSSLSPNPNCGVLSRAGSVFFMSKAI
jgi:hypothetical protein